MISVECSDERSSGTQVRAVHRKELFPTAPMMLLTTQKNKKKSNHLLHQNWEVDKTGSSAEYAAVTSSADHGFGSPQTTESPPAATPEDSASRTGSKRTKRDTVKSTTKKQGQCERLQRR